MIETNIEKKYDEDTEKKRILLYIGGSQDVFDPSANGSPL